MKVKNRPVKRRAVKQTETAKCACARNKRCGCRDHPRFYYGYQCSCVRGECDCLTKAG